MSRSAALARSVESPQAPARDAQCMLALQRANEVRLARAAVKRRLSAGTISAAEVILGPPPEIETMPLGELLMSQRRWGHVRCRRFLSALAVAENKTVGSMTQRQRGMLVAMLRSPSRGAAEALLPDTTSP